MAAPPGTLRVGRYFAALIVLLGLLYLVVGFPGARHTPKLGIDLVGGKRVIFTARTSNGQTPTSSSMSQARQIIENRINGTGVTGATVQVQGGNQLVVLIPGGTNTDVAALGQPAILNFRGVIAPAVPVTCVSAKQAAAASASATPSSTASKGSKSPASSRKSSSAAPNDVRDREIASPSPTVARTTATASRTPTSTGTSAGGTASGTGSAAASGTAAATASAGAAPSSAAAPTRCVKDPFGELKKAKVLPSVPTSEAAYTALTATQKQAVTAALANFDCSNAVNEKDVGAPYYVACDDGKTYGSRVAYLLGHIIVPGTQISNASAQAPSTSGNGGSAEWTVALNLKSSGSSKWGKWTSAHNTGGSSTGTVTSCGATSLPCSDWVGFTLNGSVVSAPYTNSAINGGTTQISGNFTQSSADSLAQQLNYGSLPLSFKLDTNESVSATLGTAQLKAAFLAGGIGLVLVVIYSLLYYRGLGLVTIASLLVSAGFTFAMLVILGTQIGFTLDLAGIAGFIVALGITADSFVVFFERIKDEVHEGRSMRVAVPRAWIRARRTILSADTVSFLAAAILYYFASADVKGFAFTLGLSTILDLVVVFLFTHPIVSLLSRSRTFGSPRFTGLNAVRVGGFSVDDELPAARPRRAGARTARARSAGATPSRAATVVLDKDLSDDIAADDTDLADGESIDDSAVVDDTSVPDRATAEVDGIDTVDDDTVDDDTVDDDEPARPARRTTPQSGTAAERAAARRARLRAKQDEEGT